jgi:hypothetical protein
VIALNNVKLLGMRRVKSVHERSVIESDCVNDEGVPFVTADGVAVPRRLGVVRMLVRQVDAANIIEAVNIIATSFSP